MRSSSIKSLTATTALALTLTLTAPLADAKPARPGNSTPRTSLTTVMKQLIARYFGIAATGLPGDPIPATAPALGAEPTSAPKPTVRQ